jgi:hypothetical protein
MKIQLITALVVAGVLGTAATAMAVNADSVVTPAPSTIVATDAPTPDPSLTPVPDEGISEDGASFDESDSSTSEGNNPNGEPGSVSGAEVSAAHQSPNAVAKQANSLHAHVAVSGETGSSLDTDSDTDSHAETKTGADSGTDLDVDGDLESGSDD